MTAKLILQDGKEFNGIRFGANKNLSGEIVFNTGMVGYPESLTDPSYFGQILILTYPIIGNYGIPKPIRDPLYKVLTNFESNKIQASGLIIGDLVNQPSHHALAKTLHKWLKEQNIPGLYGIDTRAVTIHLREKGVMLGKIDDGRSFNKDFFDPGKLNLSEEISANKPIDYKKGKIKIALVDCGVKLGIIRELLKYDISLTQLPWNWGDFSGFDGIVVSNGPGDPKKVKETITNIREHLKNNNPLLGICLGSQLLALAAGGDTYKLPYGHRSQNQPVINNKTNKCYLTTQNHGYAVNIDSLDNNWEEWFVNLNDKTNEGIKHKSKPFMAVQFHPEGNPGPEDTSWIFEEFIEICRNTRNAR